MFSLPTFNLSVNIWYTPGHPPVGPPDLAVQGNLAWGRRVAVSATGGTATLGVVLCTMTLLLPAGTVLYGDPTRGTSSLVEVPAGTGRYYHCVFVDDLGRGFENEHRGAVLVQVDPFVA